MNLIRNEMVGQLSTYDTVLEFVTGGNAYFTIRSKKTQTRFTYRVRQSQAAVEKNQDPMPYFVSVLNGSNNEDDYLFFGTMFVDVKTLHVLEYRHSRKSRITELAPSVRAIRWMLSQLHKGGDLLTQLEVWHEGRCGRCGRKLTVPESIASGFGPECIHHVKK